MRNSPREAVKIKSNMFDNLTSRGKFLTVCGYRENPAELGQSQAAQARYSIYRLCRDILKHLSNESAECNTNAIKL